MVVAPLIYFSQALRDGLVLSPDDGVIFNVPLRVVAANLFQAGYLPLWNPYIFCGMPLHGAAQGGLLFPLNWFYVAFSPPTATNLMMLLTYSVAGLGAYLYARRSGTDVAGGIVTGLVWQWGAFPIEQIGHTNIVHTAAMLPWVLWAVDGYVSTGERRSGVLVAALLALQIFAGHQQTFTYSLLLTIVYAFVMARSSTKPRKSYLVLAALMLVGLALAAVQILPTFEMLRNSLRATATYEFFGSFSMPRRFVLTFFAPYIFGGGNGHLFRAPYIERQFLGEYLAYVGVLTIMLTIVALILKRDTRTKFWAAVCLVSLLMAFGRFLPFSLYEVIYHVPLLNLFRSSSRHLLEVQFAIAVLAGRGLTAIRTSSGDKLLKSSLVAGGLVFLLTILTVTWWRPADFRLARQAPVTILRAPELFVPIMIAMLSVIALWLATRYRSQLTLVGLFGVLILDLLVYGYGSGWHTHSPGRDHDLWHEPAIVNFLRSREPIGERSYRIFTQEQPFDPSSPVPTTPTPGWIFSLQPDIYMTHGIENAGGYDGFGLSRYSKLAGDMKVWGELSDPERTLRGDSRELDLVNVRYLLTRSMSVSLPPRIWPAATRVYGGQKFGASDLNLSPILGGQRLSFTVPPTQVDSIALLTNLSWSNDVPNGSVVAHLQLIASDGQTISFDLLAGEHTSEWAYDRTDIKASIKHKRAPVATSYVVEDAHGKYEGHTYVCAFKLPSAAVVTSGSITLARVSSAPDLSLNVNAFTLVDGDKAFPLGRELMTKGSGQEVQITKGVSPVQRWKKLTELQEVAVFENTRVLPRAWLANEVQLLSEPEMLQVIRTSKLPNGQVWEPRNVALVEAPLDFAESKPIDEAREAEVTLYEPNHLSVKTNAATSSILVLSENHYPGWRTRVDGREVETLRVNYNLRGVTLPPGEHNVDFVYRPKSVLFGLVISLLTLAGLVIWWTGFGLRRKSA